MQHSVYNKDFQLFATDVKWCERLLQKTDLYAINLTYFLNNYILYFNKNLMILLCLLTTYGYKSNLNAYDFENGYLNC